MPKFAPNTGFKMPGIGSKNIDSPGNFRDEQHVDKVGYCDNTEERMLPEGSSPLKARYTTSGYLKDIEVLEFPTAPGKKEVKPPADKPPETKKIEKKTIAPEKGKEVDFNADQDFGKIKSPTTDTGKVSDKVTGTPKSTTGKGKYTDAMAYKNLGEAGVKKYGSLKNFSKEAQSGVGGRDSSGTGVNVATKGGFRDAAASTSGTAGSKTGQKVSDAARKAKEAAKKAADKIKGIFS